MATKECKKSTLFTLKLKCTCGGTLNVSVQASMIHDLGHMVSNTSWLKKKQKNS